MTTIEERGGIRGLLTKVLLTAGVIAGSLAMMVAPANAKDGISARDCGKVYGSLVSAEARAGSLGPDVGPATHQGLHGVKAFLCGGG